MYDLLIADPATAELEVVVKDEHRVGKSVVLGKGVKPLSELELGGAAWKGWVALQVGGLGGI